MLSFHMGTESTEMFCRVWKSSLGAILVCATEVGVSKVDWYDLSEKADVVVDGGSIQAGVDENSEPISPAEHWVTRAVQQLEEYFEGQREQFDLAIHVHGTVFQQAVWKALAEIPYGETRSYKQIAENIGKPAAVRAIGQANRKNPVAIMVPCHRVIGADGQLVGYAGSHTDLKADLLKMEELHRSVDSEAAAAIRLQ